MYSRLVRENELKFIRSAPLVPQIILEAFLSNRIRQNGAVGHRAVERGETPQKSLPIRRIEISHWKGGPEAEKKSVA